MVEKLVWFLLTLITGSCSVALDAPQSSELADHSGESDGFMACDGPILTNCRLTKNDLAPSPGIHVTWTVRYQFSCTDTAVTAGLRKLFWTPEDGAKRYRYTLVRIALQQ